MDPVTKEVIQVVNAVKPEMWWALLQLSGIAIIVLVLKKIYDSLAAWLMFRSNKDIGKNVRIVLNGREAIITHFTWRFIFIRFQDNGNEKIIPMGKWHNDRDWETIIYLFQN